MILINNQVLDLEARTRSAESDCVFSNMQKNLMVRNEIVLKPQDA